MSKSSKLLRENAQKVSTGISSSNIIVPPFLIPSIIFPKGPQLISKNRHNWSYEEHI